MARVVDASRSDVRAREVRVGARTAVRGGALEVRPRTFVVTLSEREHAQKLLRPAERLAPCRDPPKMRGGLARRAFGHVQLGQHHHVDIAERPQRVCVLQRHDRVGGLADLAEELSEHVVRAPRHWLRLDDFLESARRPLLVSALDGLGGQHEQPVLGPQ